MGTMGLVSKNAKGISEMKKIVNIGKLEDLIVGLRDSSSAEAANLADSLESALKDNNMDLAVSVCESMRDWATKAREVLKGKRESL